MRPGSEDHMAPGEDEGINPHQSSDPRYSGHQKSLSGSSATLLRLATQNNGLQYVEPLKSAVSPRSAYTRRSLASSNRQSYDGLTNVKSSSGYHSDASTSPYSQRTFILDNSRPPTDFEAYGPASASGRGAIGESPKDPLSPSKRKLGSNGTLPSFSGLSRDSSGSATGVSGFWNSSKARESHVSSRKASIETETYMREASPPLRAQKTSARDMNAGFTFPVRGPSRESHTVNIQDLVKPSYHGTFLDLGEGERRGSPNHARSQTDPVASRSLFLARLFSNHKDSHHPSSSYLLAPHHTHLKSHGKSVSMSASPSISAPYGVSIAAYRPVPTHSTAARVSESLSNPDIHSLDPRTTVLLPAGPSHMQKQVEDLELRRLHANWKARSNVAKGPPSDPQALSLGQNSSIPGKFRPIAAISDAQTERGERDQPVNWMRTGLSRSASQEAIQLLHPTRWETKNGCEQLVFPRPKLVAHSASPPATPEQVQRARAQSRSEKGNPKASKSHNDFVVIDKRGKEVAVDTFRSSSASPALSGMRVMDEGAERERERQEWARSVMQRKTSVRRKQAQKAESGVPRNPQEFQGLLTEGNTYFGLPPSGDENTISVFEKPSPPVSRSFGFLRNAGSLRSRSRSVTAPSRKSAASPRQFGSTSTDARSFLNGPADYADVEQSPNERHTAGSARARSNRLSRNHSSPDIRSLRSKEIGPGFDGYQPEIGPRISTPPYPIDLPAATGPRTPLHFATRNAADPVQPQFDAVAASSDESANEGLSAANDIRTRYLQMSVMPPVSQADITSPWHRNLESPRRNNLSRNATASPVAEPLPPHTARALASRLSGSPRRMRSSIEEAVNRARSSAMLMYGEDPESFANPEQGDVIEPGLQSALDTQDRRRILEAAGILPQIINRDYLTPVTEGNESTRSASTTTQLAALDRGGKPSPLPIGVRHQALKPNQSSPALSEASPWPRRPIDEMDQYDQELFFNRPQTAWSAPLAYPTPDADAAHSTRSQPSPSHPSHNDLGAPPDRRYRISKESTLSQMLSTPTTAGSRRGRASEDHSAENGIPEVTTPMSAYGDYAANTDTTANALDAPFELRIKAASPLSDQAAAATRQPSYANLNKSGSDDRLMWEAEEDHYAHGLGGDLFQGSPYLTQTDYGSDTEYAWAAKGNLLHKSSSDSTSLHLGTVPSAIVPAHRSPSMDQLKNPSYQGHHARASVVPELIEGSPATYRGSQPPTPGLAANGDSGFNLPQFESNSSFGSEGQVISLPGNDGGTPSPNTPNVFWERNSGQAEVISSIVDHFPEPPRREPLSRLGSSRSLAKPSNLQNVYPPHIDHNQDPAVMQKLLPPTFQRLDTDFSGMTGISYVTATEGYDTDETK